MAPRVIKQSQNTVKMGGDVHHFPVKLNPAGVMPVIFASVILSIPSFIAGLVGEGSKFANFVNNYKKWNIESAEELSNALLGGLAKAAEELGNSFNSAE